VYQGVAPQTGGRIMSAQAAEVVPFPAKRAPQAQPVTKLRALEHVRRLILEDQEERRRWQEEHGTDGKRCPATLTLAALSIVQYLAEVTDKETGVAIVGKQKIAERVGRSKATVKRQLRRLIELGVIEREERGNGSWCYASAYRLVDRSPPKGANHDTPRVTDDPTRGHERPLYARAFQEPFSPNGRLPYRARIAEIVYWTARDWDDCGEWLATHGKYVRWGPGPGEAHSRAMRDLERWRDRSGDGAVIAAIERAKIGNGGSGWFGDYLIERLEEMLDHG